MACGTAIAVWQLIRYFRSLPENAEWAAHMPYIRLRLKVILVNVGLFAALYIPRLIRLISEIITIVTEHTP